MDHSIRIDFDPYGYHYAKAEGDKDLPYDSGTIHVYDKPIEMKRSDHYLCRECRDYGSRISKCKLVPFCSDSRYALCEACILMALENEIYDQYIKTNFQKTVQDLYIPDTIKHLVLDNWFLNPTQEFLVDVNLDFIPHSVTNLLLCSLDLDDDITESSSKLKIPNTVKNLFISVESFSEVNVSEFINYLMIIPETTRVFISRGYYLDRRHGMFTDELTEKDNVNNYHVFPFRNNLIYIPKRNLYMGKSCKIQDEYYETDVGNFHMSDFFYASRDHAFIHQW